jgi:alcohol dehydrogenase YqhD (iron-dependent ADH family)
LKNEIPKNIKNILIVYGKSSVIKNGLYIKVVSMLSELDLKVFEFSGVEPNPKLSAVQKGIELCKKEKIEFLLAIGGGSVIDCAKTIAAGAKYNGDVWNLVTMKDKISEALPLGTVLTIAGTGSEMNSSSVITNSETNEKYSWGSNHIYPKFSIIDPSTTLTVPREQTIFGIVDLMSHVLENYFHHKENTLLQDRMCESILLTAIETAPKLLADLENYHLRETILYIGTMASNGMLSMGILGDWATHHIEHGISGEYDVPHGAGIAILFPNWMEHNIHVKPERFKQLAVRVFGVDNKNKSDIEAGLEGIQRLRKFWNSIGAPRTLSNYEIKHRDIDTLASKIMKNGDIGNFNKLCKKDVVEILNKSL